MRASRRPARRAARAGLRRLHEQVDRIGRRLRRSASCRSRASARGPCRTRADRRDASRDTRQHRQQAERERARRTAASAAARRSARRLAVDSRSTSCRIVSRVSTENTPGLHRVVAAAFGTAWRQRMHRARCGSRGPARRCRTRRRPSARRAPRACRRAMPTHRGSPVPPRCRTGRRAWRLLSGRAAASPRGRPTNSGSRLSPSA